MSKVFFILYQMEEYQIKGALHILLKYIIEDKSIDNNFLVKKHKPKIYNINDKDNPLNGGIDIDWILIKKGLGALERHYSLLIHISKDKKTISYYADNIHTKQQWEGKFNLDDFEITGFPYFILI